MKEYPLELWLVQVFVMKSLTTVVLFAYVDYIRQNTILL